MRPSTAPFGRARDEEPNRVPSNIVPHPERDRRNAAEAVEGRTAQKQRRKPSVSDDGLDGFEPLGERGFGHAQIVRLLKVQPVLRRLIEDASEQ